MARATPSINGSVVDYDPEVPFVPLGLRLYAVMPGRSTPTADKETRIAHIDAGPISIIFQAESARQVYEIIAGHADSAWLIRGVTDADRWIADHVMEIPPKDGPAVLQVTRKDFD